MSLIARYRSTFFLGIGFFAIVAHLSTTTVAQPPDGRDARFKRTHCCPTDFQMKAA